MLGTVTEQVSSRRTWRLGGGFIKYTSKSTLSYDGDTRCAFLCDEGCGWAWHSCSAGVYDEESTADANSSPCRGAAGFGALRRQALRRVPQILS